MAKTQTENEMFRLQLQLLRQQMLQQPRQNALRSDAVLEERLPAEDNSIAWSFELKHHSLTR